MASEGVNYCYCPSVISLCQGLEAERKQEDCKYHEYSKVMRRCIHNPFDNVCTCCDAQKELKG